jgi:hypothetical protein
MNSRVFVPNPWFDVERPGFHRWMQVPVVMTGMAHGQKRSEAIGSTIDLTSINYGETHRSFQEELANASDDVRREASAYFKRSFLPQAIRQLRYLMSVDPIFQWLPWNVPINLGGLGFPGKMSKSDELYCRYMNFVNRNPPRPTRMWLFHDLVHAQLRAILGPMGPVTDRDPADLGPLYWSILCNKKHAVLNMKFVGPYGNIDSEAIQLAKDKYLNYLARFHKNMRGRSIKIGRKKCANIPVVRGGEGKLGYLIKAEFDPTALGWLKVE